MHRHQHQIDDDARKERKAEARFARDVRKALLAARLISRRGDGRGGLLRAMFDEAMREVYPEFFVRNAPKSTSAKMAISRQISKLIMERDEYRCVSCGTHIDLTIDHIFPESKGGSQSVENLQTMCRSCNSKKGNRTLESIEVG